MISLLLLLALFRLPVFMHALLLILWEYYDVCVYMCDGADKLDGFRRKRHLSSSAMEEEVGELSLTEYITRKMAEDRGPSKKRVSVCVCVHVHMYMHACMSKCYIVCLTITLSFEDTSC